MQAVCFWRDGVRTFPPEYAAQLSEVSGVARWEMRPLDWHLIWPELVGSAGAPDPQATQQ